MTEPMPPLPPSPHLGSSEDGPAIPEPTERPSPRRRPGLVAGGIALVVVLVAGSVLFVAQGRSAEARPLALSFTEGQSETYANHVTIDGRMSGDEVGEIPMRLELEYVTTWHVVSVDGDGVATIEVSTEDQRGSLNGIEMPPAPASPPFEIVVAPDGRILSAGGLTLEGIGGVEGFTFPGLGQVTPILPDDGAAVAPGDTWDKQFSQEVPFVQGTLEYTASSTYERNETVGEGEAAVIVTELSMPLDFTVYLSEIAGALGEIAGGSGPSGVDGLSEGSIETSGSTTTTQTSFVDLGAMHLLRSESAGELDLSVEVSGEVGIEGSIRFTGTFSQELERR